MKKLPPQKSASKPYLEIVQDAHKERRDLINFILGKACEAMEGLDENGFWDCDGTTGAALWSIFDRTWCVLMDEKEPISPKLFEKYPIKELDLD